MPENEEAVPVAEAQQEAAQASDAKAEATSTAKASDELAEYDLEAVAGHYQGAGKVPQGLHTIPAIDQFALDHSHHQPGHNHSPIICMKYYAGR